MLRTPTATHCYHLKNDYYKAVPQKWVISKSDGQVHILKFVLSFSKNCLEAFNSLVSYIYTFDSGTPFKS